MRHKSSAAIAAVFFLTVSLQTETRERPVEQTPEALTSSSSDRRRPIGETPPISGRALVSSLRLSEVMYHPNEGGAEFLELTNTGIRNLAIGGVRFTDGIDFVFPPGTILAPGEFAVIAASEADFVAAYPGVALAGEYSGALSNAGETLTIESPGGGTLLTLRYDDDVPWPTEADGLGNSMVIADAAADPIDPTSWCASADTMGSPGESESQACPAWVDPTDAIFDPLRLLDIRIQMDPGDFEQLRLQERSVFDIHAGEDCQDQPFDNPFTYFPATIEVDGVRIEQAGVRKKGWMGSLRRDKPSFKVKFAEYVAGQRLSGLRRLTLNNAVQDPSYINQCLGYKLFRAGGLPAPRCNFAVVTVNDEPLGVYAHVESIRERFIARNFGSVTGNLFEAMMSDFRDGWTGTFELKGDEGDGDRTVIDDMVVALQAPDDQLTDRLEELIDLDAFLTFWAMEVLVGHWDGYGGNANNYFIYHDPDNGLLHFMPWGADQLFGEGGRQSVMAVGALTRRLYLYEPTRKRYVDRVLDLLDTPWHEPTILDEIERMRQLILPHLESNQTDGFEEAVERDRVFVSERRPQLMNELLPDPPAWDVPIRESICLRRIHEVSATFETTWGSLERDGFEVGSGSMDLTYNGRETHIRRVGAIIGPGDNPGLPVGFAIAAETWDGPTFVIWIEMEPALVTTGATIELAQPGISAALVLIDQNVSPDPQFLGPLADGQLHFEEAGTDDGDVVRGTIEAGVWQ